MRGECWQKSCHEHDVRSVMYTFLCIFHVCDIHSLSKHTKRIISCVHSLSLSLCPRRKAKVSLFLCLNSAEQLFFPGEHYHPQRNKIKKEWEKEQHTIYHHEFSLEWENFSAYRDVDLSDFDFLVFNAIQLMIKFTAELLFCDFVFDVQIAMKKFMKEFS